MAAIPNYPKKQVLHEREQFSLAVWESLHDEVARVYRQLRVLTTKRRRNIVQRDIDLLFRMVDSACARHGNVVDVHTVTAPEGTSSADLWAEHFVVAPTAIHGGFRLSRIHMRLNSERLAMSSGDMHLTFSDHVGERMIERGVVAHSPVLALVKSAPELAGHFAIGARLWSSLWEGGGWGGKAVIPLRDGFLVGRVHLSNMEGNERKKARLSGFGMTPFVSADDGQKYGIGFVAMTYIPCHRESSYRTRARDKMVDFARRHPVIKVLGAHLLYSTSPFLRKEIDRQRVAIADAYRAYLDLFSDPDVIRIFALSGPVLSAPPLPWNEDEASLKRANPALVPVFASDEEIQQAIERASGEVADAERDDESDDAEAVSVSAPY